MSPAHGFKVRNVTVRSLVCLPAPFPDSLLLRKWTVAVMKPMKSVLLLMSCDDKHLPTYQIFLKQRPLLFAPNPAYVEAVWLKAT